MDVTDYEGPKAGVESIIAEHGHIDILINNALVPCVAPIAEIPISFFEKTFQTNVFGPVVLINSVVPHVVARGKGRIVNVGSIVSLCYGPWGGGYTSTKAALEDLTDALRSAVSTNPIQNTGGAEAFFGIDVVLLLPGANTSNISGASMSRTQSGVLQGLKLYKPFEQDLLKRTISSEITSKSTPTEKFAKKGVAQVTSKSPPAHYAYGYMTTLFSILFYTPFWLRDFMWAKYFGVDKKKLTSLTDCKTD